MNSITFERVHESALSDFKQRLQAAFALAVTAPSNEPIPPDDDIERNFYQQDAETYNIYHDGMRVGGVMLTINNTTHDNHLDFFFIEPTHHSKGLGFTVWQAIERKYPETKIWRTGTPYFEKRNIHFYVNKCGFQIHEFFCKHHPDPNFPPEDAANDGAEFEDGFFSFIKVMTT